MRSEIQKEVVVVFSGDETNARRKTDGATIIDQAFLSLESIRKNWNSEIEILFIHTQPLTESSLCHFEQLNVATINVGRQVHSLFPIANKMLVGEAYKGKKHILFLDCDTIVHKPLDFQLTTGALVAFDALQDVTEENYKRLYAALGVDLPQGSFSKNPSFEYYYHNRRDMFPLLNSGVYFIQNRHKDSFYNNLLENFHKTYELFRGELNFYFDQICFALTLHQLGIEYDYFPKGYNFICTKRAPYLKDWPKEEIYIEHYAGNNSRPLVFKGNKIDLQESGIVIEDNV